MTQEVPGIRLTGVLGIPVGSSKSSSALKPGSTSAGFDDTRALGSKDSGGESKHHPEEPIHSFAPRLEQPPATGG